MSELDRLSALLGVGPRVIEAALTSGRGFRQVLAERGVPETGSFGPAAALSFLGSAAVDPLTPLTVGAGRLAGVARAARPVLARTPAQLEAGLARTAAQEADVVGARIAGMPRAQGGVMLSRPLPTEVPPAPRVSIPKPLQQEVLKEPVHRRITVAAEELFTRAGIERDPQLRVSDQITRLLQDERLPVRELDATLRRHNLSITEFSNEVFRPSIKDAARRMQALSALQHRLNLLFQNAPEHAAKLRELAGEVDTMLAARNLWRAPVNIWRGLLVSQPATAARNFVTQVGRIGLDVLDQGLQAGWQRVTGKPVTASPVEPLRVLVNIFWRPRAIRARTEGILFHLPAQWDRMFGTFSSDVATRARAAGYKLSGKDRILQGAQDGVSMLNVANRFQEFVTRRAVFEAYLWQRLRVQGKDLVKIIARNEIDAVPEDAIKAAVEKSLEMTFARTPQRGTVAFHFVRFINGLGPLAAPAIPFPRFMTEALRFYFEFSPTGLLKLLAPAERAALAAGNTQVLTRATVGAGMLGTAYAFRRSEFAGERWYQGKLPDGRVIDFRPFNPFSPYLFAADVIRRHQDGTLYRLDARDLFQAFAGVSTRAGTGLYLLDQLLDQFSDEGRAQKALTKIRRVGGEVLSGFLTPLQTLVDVMSEFDQSLRVVREEGEEPLTAPIKAKIPGLRQQLPEVELPTRAGPLLREAPLLRQVTGITLGQAPNALELELDRLQFNRQEILPSTGDARANRLIARHQGMLAEILLVPFVTGSTYRNLSDAEKGEVLRRALAEVRKVARARAEAEDPQLFARLRYQKRPVRERRLIEQQTTGRQK